MKSARKHGMEAIRLGTLPEDSYGSLPLDAQGRRLRSTTLLTSEKSTYQMLARGNAPQSEPFREWVFGEVLPSIRKTGQYNVNASELATSPPPRTARSSPGSWPRAAP